MHNEEHVLEENPRSSVKNEFHPPSCAASLLNVSCLAQHLLSILAVLGLGLLDESIKQGLYVEVPHSYGWRSLWGGAILLTAGCWGVSLGSTHQGPGAATSVMKSRNVSIRNQVFLQGGRAKFSPPVNHCDRQTTDREMIDTIGKHMLRRIGDR